MSLEVTAYVEESEVAQAIMDGDLDFLEIISSLCDFCEWDERLAESFSGSFSNREDVAKLTKVAAVYTKLMADDDD